jgi:hypothetical protein
MLKKYSILLVLLLLIAVGLPAQAQNGPTFSTMRVSLWPEFDRPDLLVIYRMNLSGSTTLPANLTIRIPAAGTEVHAVAVGEQEDMVGDVPYNRVINGEWAEITFIATMPSIQFEYYDSNLGRSGNRRSISYQWTGDYAVEALMVEVQEPLRATGMRISPSLGSRQLRSDGLGYYVADLGALTAGQTFNITLEYEKDSDQLTAEQLVVQPSQPIVQNTPGGLKNGGVLLLSLGVLGLALILGGGIWYWQSGTLKEEEKPRRRGRRSARTPPPQQESEDGVYCHQCGKRAAGGDRFCRSCGIRLRLE